MMEAMSDSRSETVPERAQSGERGLRLWRLRKLHQSVDAELSAGIEDVELRFLYNGEIAYGRRRPNRALAVQEATEKRAELEREGWVFHW